MLKITRNFNLSSQFAKTWLEWTVWFILRDWIARTPWLKIQRSKISSKLFTYVVYVDYAMEQQSIGGCNKLPCHEDIGGSYMVSTYPLMCSQQFQNANVKASEKVP
ncbi:hypothetical protein SUGI_0812140 [Cryptomeria japonica]|nr:hypothetical protein SUGI_0812140 [Cryptomeria japonica]